MSLSVSTFLAPIVNLLKSMRDILYSLWNVYYDLNLKYFAICALAGVSIRAAVSLTGRLFTKLYTIRDAVEVAGTDLANTGVPTGGFLDKVNAVLPVAETSAFIAGLIALYLITTGYMFLRSAYNAVPLKAS